MRKPSTRRFSKLMFLVNGALAWGAVYLSVWRGTPDGGLANAALGLIGLLYTAYTGVGHLDFRRAMHMAREAINSQVSPPDEPTQ